MSLNMGKLHLEAKAEKIKRDKEIQHVFNGLVSDKYTLERLELLMNNEKAYIKHCKERGLSAKMSEYVLAGCELYKKHFEHK